MAVLFTDTRRALHTIAVLSLAGSAVGVLTPHLQAWLGATGSVAALAFGFVTAGWLARDGAGPFPGRALLALAGGATVGSLLPVLPAGLSHVLLGLVVGLALVPEGLRGRLSTSLARSLPTAAGALVGGVLAGWFTQSAAFAALSTGTQAAWMGMLVGAGVGLGEASRLLLVVREDAPAWIEALRKDVGAETRPVLEAALDAHGRVVRAVVDGAHLDAWDRQESLHLAEQLLASTASAVRAADEACREGISLQSDEELEPHTELSKARARIRESLRERTRQAKAEAGRHAANLARMAAALVEPTEPTTALFEALPRTTELERRTEVFISRREVGIES